MIIFLIFSLIFLILVFPIPLKLSVKVDKGYYEIKLYNIIISSTNKRSLNDILHKIQNEKQDTNRQTKGVSHKRNKLKKKSFSFSKLYRKLTCNKFKPFLKIKGSINLGLEDAAVSAILYGLLCNLNTFLKIITSKVFNTKQINIAITPCFKNKKILTFDIISIFYFNFANIIYILILIYSSFEKNKKVTP